MNPSPNKEAKTASVQALAELFHSHETQLLRYAMQLTRDTQTAQDLVQDAFIKLQPVFPTVENPRAWLYKTIHNLAVNHHRKHQRIVRFADKPDTSTTDSPPPEHDPIDPDPLPNIATSHHEAIGEARRLIATLPPREQRLIELKFEEDLSYQEIADALDLSVSNVGYLLHKILKKLNAHVCREGGALS